MPLPIRLILVRHGESEGDVIRSARKSGDVNPWTIGFRPKNTKDHRLTPKGLHQSREVKRWLHGNQLKPDHHIHSTTPRAGESAKYMSNKNSHWKSDGLLAERARGKIMGMTFDEHERIYPDSYKAMLTDPIGWTPPEGESLRQVMKRANKFITSLSGIKSDTVIVVTHRDWMVASTAALEGKQDQDLIDVIKNSEHELLNCQIVEYCRKSPDNKTLLKHFGWKRSTCPWINAKPGDWHKITEFTYKV